MRKPAITPDARPKRTVPKTAWKPGQSGNPLGRKKLSDAQREAKELKADAQPDAVRALAAIVRDPGKHETRDVIAASKALLEGLDATKLELSGAVTSEVTHTVAPMGEDKMRRVLLVVERTGVLAQLRETKPLIEGEVVQTSAQDEEKTT